MKTMTAFADKAGALGTLVSAAACPACFPALASLGAALGLGVLAEYEALFVTRLLPVFASLALLANALGWFSHRRWQRSALGMAGPAVVLVALGLLFSGQPLAQPLLYTGLVLMVTTSLWDLLSRSRSRSRQVCGAAGCAQR